MHVVYGESTARYWPFPRGGQRTYLTRGRWLAARAAKIMWDCDCGVVPVVDEERRVVGMVTDRDICMAAATRAAKPSDIQVRDVMSRDVASCGVGDDVHVALNTMKAQRVRRLAVLD